MAGATIPHKLRHPRCHRPTPHQTETIRVDGEVTVRNNVLPLSPRPPKWAISAPLPRFGRHGHGWVTQSPHRGHALRLCNVTWIGAIVAATLGWLV